MQGLYCFLFLSCFALIIVFCEWLHKKGLHAEYTRKTAHALSTLQCLLFPVFFTSHRYALILVIITSSILYIGRQKDFFKSIDSVKRKTCGSYLLPISIGIVYYLSLLLDDWVFFVLPVIVLAISDSLACIFGRIYKSGHLKSGKTVIGSIVFFLSTLIISCCILLLQSAGIKTFGVAFGVSLITTGVELVSPSGSDNLTVSLSVIGSMLLLDTIL